MKLALVTVVALACCKPAPSGGPVSATQVFVELVDAGLMDPTDDGGIAAIEQEHAQPDQPAWLACLFDGGSVAVCNVPKQ